MHAVMRKVAFAALMGGSLALGGCATKEEVEHAQATADQALAAAQQAQSTAAAAQQSADSAHQEINALSGRVDALERKGQRG